MHANAEPPRVRKPFTSGDSINIAKARSFVNIFHRGGGIKRAAREPSAEKEYQFRVISDSGRDVECTLSRRASAVYVQLTCMGVARPPDTELNLHLVMSVEEEQLTINPTAEPAFLLVALVNFEVRA